MGMESDQVFGKGLYCAKIEPDKALIAQAYKVCWKAQDQTNSKEDKVRRQKLHMK